MSAALVRALKQERERHERAGRTARVALVDAELAKLGEAAGFRGVEETRKLETAAASPPPETVTEPRGADHVCDECGRAFARPAALGAHKRSHAAPKADDE